MWHRSKKNKLKFTILLGLCLPLHAFASSTTGVNLVVPDSQATYIFAVEGAFLETNSVPYTQAGQVPFADLGYPGYPSHTPPYGVPLTTKSVSSHYQFAEGLDLTYIFPASSFDLGLQLRHIAINSQAKYNQPSTSFIVAPLAGGSAYAAAKSQLNQLINTVDLNLGETFKLGESVAWHPFLGLRLADINDNLDNSYYNNQHLNPQVTSLFVVDTDLIRNHFEGLGPRLGLDTRWHLFKGLSLVNTAAVSLLVGRLDQEKTYTSPFVIAAVSPWIYQQNNTSFIPEWDAKLGLNYRFISHKGYAVETELGYEASMYYQIASINGPESESLGNNRYANEFLSSNLSYQGPYMRLQFELK